MLPVPDMHASLHFVCPQVFSRCCGAACCQPSGGCRQLQPGLLGTGCCALRCHGDGGSAWLLHGHAGFEEQGELCLLKPLALVALCQGFVAAVFTWLQGTTACMTGRVVQHRRAIH